MNGVQRRLVLSHVRGHVKFPHNSSSPHTVSVWGTLLRWAVTPSQQQPAQPVLCSSSITFPERSDHVIFFSPPHCDHINHCLPSPCFSHNSSLSSPPPLLFMGSLPLFCRPKSQLTNHRQSGSRGHVDDENEHQCVDDCSLHVEWSWSGLRGFCRILFRILFRGCVEFCRILSDFVGICVGFCIGICVGICVRICVGIFLSV